MSNSELIIANTKKAKSATNQSDFPLSFIMFDFNHCYINTLFFSKDKKNTKLEWTKLWKQREQKNHHYHALSMHCVLCTFIFIFLPSHKLFMQWNEKQKSTKTFHDLKRIFLVLDWALRKQSMPKSKTVWRFFSRFYFIIFVRVLCCIHVWVVMGRLHFLLTAFYCYIVSSFLLLLSYLPCGIAFSIWLSFFHTDFAFVLQFQVCFYGNSFVFVSVR